MTHIDLDRLLELAEKATPGPWRNRGEFGIDTSRCNVIYACDGHVYSEYSSDGATIDARHEDLEFICACDPDTIRALVKCVRAAKEFNRRHDVNIAPDECSVCREFVES